MAATAEAVAFAAEPGLYAVLVGDSEGGVGAHRRGEPPREVAGSKPRPSSQLSRHVTALLRAAALVSLNLIGHHLVAQVAWTS